MGRRTSALKAAALIIGVLILGGVSALRRNSHDNPTYWTTIFPIEGLHGGAFRGVPGSALALER
jgi:hypothetical protein